MQQTLAQALDPAAMPIPGTFSRLFESGLGYPGASLGRMPGAAAGGGGMAASWGDGDATNTGVHVSLAQVGALLGWLFLMR